MQNIQLSYPSYFLFFIIVIAALYALSLYVNETKLKENKSWLPTTLGMLRWLSVLVILFLLLTPLFKLFNTEKEKPIIVIAQDISGSIDLSNDSTQLTQLKNALTSLKQNLGSEYQWDEFYFGQKINLDNSDSLNKLSTNISSSLDFISENYEDQNIGAVILSSDGIYNEGKNPIYANFQLNAPIHVIPLGDTSSRRDILVKNIFHNRIVYLNDKFKIEADIQAYNAQGAKSKLVLSKIESNTTRVIDSRNINIGSDRYFETFEFELTANTVGNTKYVIGIQPIPNEVSNVNNQRNIYLEVLDARQKVLIVARNSHPDIKTLKNIINSNKNYELEIVYAEDINSSVKEYDIAILHNLPSQEFPLNDLIKELNTEKTPKFFIIGNNIDRQSFNTSQNVLSLNGKQFSLNNVTPVPNSSFSSFTTSDNFNQRIQTYVPLKAPYGEYQPEPHAKTLLYQKIGSVETRYPLLSYSDINGQKEAVLAGEGIWKWNLMEFYEGNVENSLTKEIILKTIQYISQKEDKRQFRTYTNKRDYKENEAVLFDAQLYNDNYEMINAPETKLSVTNESNERFDYVFSKNDNYYVVNTGRFPEGSYSYTASTSYNGKNLNASGRFSVQSIAKEEYDLTARHNVLYQLADKTGGDIIYPDQINKLDSLITNNNTIKPILYQKAETKSLLNWPWLLLIIIFLLSTEWFLRRYFGAY